MSNHTAVATVTTTIRHVIQRALGPVAGAVVTTRRLDQLASGQPAESTGVNVLLYQVTPNHAGDLTDLPIRDARGRLTARPHVALDLSYLITGYGDEASLTGQRTLALAMLALAATPVLTRDTVRSAVQRYSTRDGLGFLDDADLENQAELVKLSQVPLTIEELTRLWGLFPQAHFELSVAYRATVVVLETDVQTRTALPVVRPVVAVEAMSRPEIETAGAASPPLVVTGELIVTGSGLVPAGDVEAFVEVGGVRLPAVAGATSTEVRALVVDGVPAGVQRVRVCHVRPAAAGNPERTVAISNALAVLIHPTVTVNGVTASNLVLTIHPFLRPRQRAVVRLHRLGPTTADVGLAVEPLDPTSAPAGSIAVEHGDVPPGTYLVQFEVDGVSSIPLHLLAGPDAPVDPTQQVDIP